jgi:hypothetical protein
MQQPGIEPHRRRFYVITDWTTDANTFRSSRRTWFLQLRVHAIYGEMAWHSEGGGSEVKVQYEEEVVERRLKNAREEESNPCMSPCPVS